MNRAAVVAQIEHRQRRAGARRPPGLADVERARGAIGLGLEQRLEAAGALGEVHDVIDQRVTGLQRGREAVDRQQRAVGAGQLAFLGRDVGVRVQPRQQPLQRFVVDDAEARVDPRHEAAGSGPRQREGGAAGPGAAQVIEHALFGQRLEVGGGQHLVDRGDQQFDVEGAADLQHAVGRQRLLRQRRHPPEHRFEDAAGPAVERQREVVLHGAVAHVQAPGELAAAGEAERLQHELDRLPILRRDQRRHHADVVGDVEAEQEVRLGRREWHESTALVAIAHAAANEPVAFEQPYPLRCRRHLQVVGVVLARLHDERVVADELLFGGELHPGWWQLAQSGDEVVELFPYPLTARRRRSHR